MTGEPPPTDPLGLPPGLSPPSAAQGVVEGVANLSVNPQPAGGVPTGPPGLGTARVPTTPPGLAQGPPGLGLQNGSGQENGAAQVNGVGVPVMPPLPAAAPAQGHPPAGQPGTPSPSPPPGIGTSAVSAQPQPQAQELPQASPQPIPQATVPVPVPASTPTPAPAPDAAATAAAPPVPTSAPVVAPAPGGHPLASASAATAATPPGGHPLASASAATAAPAPGGHPLASAPPQGHPLATGPPPDSQDSGGQGYRGRGGPPSYGYDGRGYYGGQFEYQGHHRGRRDLEFENLGERLAGVIMGCTDGTKQECLDNKIFGLPPVHWPYVKNIQPGMQLYLFSYTRRCLYGLFKAESEGQMNIDQYGADHTLLLYS